MDRFGIFVDAAYVYSVGGELLHHATGRERLRLDASVLVRGLESQCRAHGGMELLRTWWYDGAHDAEPTPAHLEIARIPSVKLRLGRLVKGRQKGVDAKFVRDLLLAAFERSIQTAYVVTDDEDLVEALTESQVRGLRVVLMTVDEPPDSWLTDEADEALIVDRAVLTDALRLREPDPDADPVAAEFAGRAFAEQWLERASAAEVAQVRGDMPHIPFEIDRQLVLSVAQPGRRLSEDERIALRRGFWEVAAAQGAPQPQPEPLQG